MNDNRKNEGITLVALVVTIIVILILSGIMISLALGNNGLINRAQSSYNKTVEAGEQENLQIAIMDLDINNSLNNEKPFLDYVLSCEEYLQSKLNTSNLHIDSANKRIMYNGNIFSISEIGQLSIEDKGIILNTNNLYMQLQDGEGIEKKIEAKLHNIEGNIEWQTSDETIATVEDGTIIPKKEGVAYITAVCIDGNEYKASCKVNVEAFIDDSYVQYDIEYDDIYSGKRFTKNTGWRLIKQEENEDGTYNIEFISTGIPCNFCYGWYEINSANWKPTAAKKNEYTSKFYDSSSNGNACYAAAGLYFNFEKITFMQGLTGNNRNMGGYRRIITKNSNNLKEEVNGNILGDIFKTRGAATVRNVTLSDVRGYDKIQGVATNVTAYNSGNDNADIKKGLYKLNDYTPDKSVSKLYYVSNPTAITTFYHLLIITSAGTNNSSNGARIAGLRPVIAIDNVNLEKDGAVWIIK